MKREELQKKLKELQVLYPERVTLRSGEVSDFYCDIKKTFGHPEILNALADEVGSRLPQETTCIAVSGYGGLPLGSVIASRFNKKLVAVRGTPKKHGKGGVIDGYVPTDTDVIVIVDDVLTSGSSIKETLEALNTMGLSAESAIVVVKRGDAEIPIPFTWVFAISDLT